MFYRCTAYLAAVAALAVADQVCGQVHGGDVIVDRIAKEDDPLLQEAGVDVEGALTPTRLFDDHGDQVVAGKICAHRSSLSSATVSSETTLPTTFAFSTT
jgi:hypothetical protein